MYTSTFNDMSVNFEVKKNTQAASVTGGVALLILLLMLFWKWTIPQVIPPPLEESLLVEINLPDEPEIPARNAGAGGTEVSAGGGGGNPVEAGGVKGTASAPQQPGDMEDSKDIEESNDLSTPAIHKPNKPDPKAKKINESKSPTVAKPKVVAEPAPQKPKAQLGKTTNGTGTGGGAATTYERAGGTGTGSGVGTGSGSGGGSGTGAGGGRGSGIGSTVGPRVMKGDRSIVSSYTFRGDMDRATINAVIRVTPDGSGTFIRFGQGSTSQSSNYRVAITDYLKRIKFNKSDKESEVTVQFKFVVEG